MDVDAEAEALVHEQRAREPRPPPQVIVDPTPELRPLMAASKDPLARKLAEAIEALVQDPKGASLPREDLTQLLCTRAGVTLAGDLGQRARDLNQIVQAQRVRQQPLATVTLDNIIASPAKPLQACMADLTGLTERLFAEEDGAMALSNAKQMVASKAVKYGPTYIQRTIEQSLNNIRRQLDEAVKGGNYKMAYALNSQEMAVYRKYVTEYQPLVKALGHTKALELFKARSSLLEPISDEQMAIVTGLAQGGKFKEALEGLGWKPTTAEPKAPKGGEGSGVITCPFCGVKGHPMADCTKWIGAMAKVGKAQHAPAHEGGKGKAQFKKGQGKRGQSD